MELLVDDSFSFSFIALISSISLEGKKHKYSACVSCIHAHAPPRHRATAHA
jgi:hypothetical protein